MPETMVRRGCGSGAAICAPDGTLLHAVRGELLRRRIAGEAKLRPTMVLGQTLA